MVRRDKTGPLYAARLVPLLTLFFHPFAPCGYVIDYEDTGIIKDEEPDGPDDWSDSIYCHWGLVLNRPFGDGPRKIW